MKKIILIGLLLSALVFSGFKYYEEAQQKAYEEYIEYARSTYELDKSQIENVEVAHYEILASALPQVVTVVNLLGEEKELPVSYTIGNSALDAEKLVFDYMPEENIKTLKDSELNIQYIVEGFETGEVLVNAHLDEIEIKPIVKENGDISVDVLEIKAKEHTFEIPIERIIKEKILQTKQPVTKVQNGRHVITVIKKGYEDESNYFNLIYKGGFENRPELLSAVKSAFDELPLNIKTYVAFSGLELTGSQFENVDAQYIEDVNDFYNENWTIDEYLDFVLATHTRGEKKIKFNLRPGSGYDVNEYDFNKVYLDIDINNKYSEFKYGVKDVLKVNTKAEYSNYLKSSIKETFLHELTHFLDSESGVKTNLTEFEMESFLGVYPYKYEQNHIIEHLAYAGQVYLENQKFLKENSPVMYEKVNKIMISLDMSEATEYTDAMTLLSNWTTSN